MTRIFARLAAVTLFAMNGVPANAADTLTHVSDPKNSSLVFSFRQAGAEAQGRFARFEAQLETTPAGDPRALRVTVAVASLDTGDKERDATLRGADLFDVSRHPQARFESAQIRSAGQVAGRHVAAGKLTIRGVTRNVSLPLDVRRDDEGGLTLEGEIVIRRLDFGVGRGEWAGTEWVGNDVTIRYAVTLRPAAGPPAASVR